MAARPPPIDTQIEPDSAASSTHLGSADTSRATSPNPPPPYWQSHIRNPSQLSQVSVDGRPLPIQMTDNTLPTSETAQACWAKAARVDSHVVISGSTPGIGDYIVWNCTIDTLNGGFFVIRKRYSEFDRLCKNLKRTFPNAGASLPHLPPKSIIKRFEKRFLEKRQQGLSNFLHCVLLNPEFSASPVIRDFLLA